MAWHRDNVNRRYGLGPDWDESAEAYRLVRVGLCLQGSGANGVTLNVVTGGHRIGGLGFVQRGCAEQAASCPRLLHAGDFAAGPKYSVFLVYGVPGAHYDRHRLYYRRWRPGREVS